MDLESRRRWELYTKAKETMLERTHIPEAPWWVVEAVDKKRARLNCIAHLLTRIPYQEVPHEKPVLPARVHNPEYHRNPVPPEMYVPDHYGNPGGGSGEIGEGGKGESQGTSVRGLAVIVRSDPAASEEAARDLARVQLRDHRRERRLFGDDNPVPHDREVRAGEASAGAGN